MARQRTQTQDFADSVGEPLSEVTMDGFLSSSWPAAAPPMRQLQPPRAPLRKPSAATWEVPELQLGKRRRTHSGSASTDAEEHSLGSFDGQSEEEEEDDFGIFALEGAANGDDDDAFGGAFDMGLVGLDDDDMGVVESKGFSFGYSGHESAPLPMGLSCSVPMGRFQYESADNSLGASPMLMSVLDQVAQAQASGRGRADSL